MVDGIEGAAAAFAEDLGGSAPMPQARRSPSENGEVGGTEIEDLANPTHDVFEPGGGDVDHDDGDEHEEAGDIVEGKRPAKGSDGRFVSRKPATEGRDTKGASSVQDLLDDPLDDEEGGEENDEGSPEERSTPVSVRDLDPDAEVEVTVDGKPEKVTFKEMSEGYIRQATFHQRLSQLDVAVKDTRKQRDEVNQHRTEYVQKLQDVVKQLDSMTPKEPDWDKLYAEQPNEAGKIERQWNTYKRQREQLDKELADQSKAQQEASLRQYNEYRDDEARKFATAHPEYGENKADGQKRWERDRNGMAETAKAHGFSDEEINNTIDSRYMEILLKASKYDRLVKRGKPVASRQQPTSRTNVGGASRTPATQNANRRLARTGSTRDAASVFQQEILREG